MPAPGATILPVCGLAAEARFARGGIGVRSIAGSGDAATLGVAIEDQIGRGAAALISFGIAGALAPALVPGTLIIARHVCMPDGRRIATDPRWATAMRHLVADASFAELAGSDVIVSGPRQKAELQARSGAVAVDMESHVVARAATAHRLPFVALRAIADPATRRMPAAATVAMRAGGGVDAWAVLASLAREPGQLGDLIRIAADARKALVALRRSRRLLGDRLGYIDFDELPAHVV